jgi:hypothetical protein
VRATTPNGIGNRGKVSNRCFLLSVIAGLDPAIHAMTLQLHRPATSPVPATAALLNRHGMDSGPRRFAACPE